MIAERFRRASDGKHIIAANIFQERRVREVWQPASQGVSLRKLAVEARRRTKRERKEARRKAKRTADVILSADSEFPFFEHK